MSLAVFIESDSLLGSILKVSLLTSIKEIRSTIKLKNKHVIIPFQESKFVENDKKSIDLDQISAIVLKLHGPLFFGAVVSLINSYQSAQEHEMLIVDLEYVQSTDVSGVYALEDLINNANNNNVRVTLVNVNQSIKDMLTKLNFFKHFKAEDCLDSKELIYPLISNHFKLD